MVKVILNGCSGKMGSVISNLAETKFPNVEIVAGIDNNTNAQRSYPIFAGYTAEDLKFIEESSKEIPLFRSANMSIGINLVNNLLKKVAPVLYENFDIELVERHHNQKVDAPSGTALLLAHTIQDSLNEETKLLYGREGIAKREKNEICVNTVRGGGIIGDHEVIFAGDGEVIEINHKAISRDVFAIGALKACEYMADKTKAGKYSMDDVLQLNF